MTNNKGKCKWSKSLEKERNLELCRIYSCLLVCRVWSRPCVHELLHDGGVSADGGVVKRGMAELVGAVRICVEVDENLRKNDDIF